MPLYGAGSPKDQMQETDTISVTGGEARGPRPGPKRRGAHGWSCSSG